MKHRTAVQKPEQFDGERWLQDQVTAAVEEWWRLQYQDMYSHLHLYYRQSVPDLSGALTVASEQPVGFVLADNRRISPAWEKRQAWRFIWEVSQRLPVLPHIRQDH